MKKIIAIAAAALLTVAAFAQKNPLPFNVTAGYVQSTATYQSKPGADVNYTQSNGAYAGFGFEYTIIKGLSIAPGVYYEYLYSSDAASTNIGELGTISGTTTLKEHYINIPLTLNFGYEITPGIRLFAFGGPTFSLGIDSKTYVHGTATFGSINLNSDDVINNYTDEDGNPTAYGPADILLGVGAGADYNEKLRIFVGYDWGMLNRNTDSESTAIRHRNQLRAGIAYIF